MIDMAPTVARDFARLGDLETVRLKFADGPHQKLVEHSLKRPIRRREMEASRGFYQAHDVTWVLKASECDRAPVPGCLVIDSDDGEWTVLTAAHESLRSVYACACRNLVITERLDTLVTVQLGTFAKAAGGADEGAWADLYTNVRGRMQPEDSSGESERGQRKLKRKYTLFLREPFALRRQHRIVDSAGKLYRPTGFQFPERIDRLTEITCEEW